ncbi:hypothetical protein [Mycobacterium sp. Aquia_216]|uniref:hypothetical protein n=1 Tax=Mycobacterium sp. Aquia_216 TaxID=2991729 RepID=UPI002DD66D8B|nr:hypothetical protein [Mycobacterium sp. Aquia_216]
MGVAAPVGERSGQFGKAGVAMRPDLREREDLTAGPDHTTRGCVSAMAIINRRNDFGQAIPG